MDKNRLADDFFDDKSSYPVQPRFLDRFAVGAAGKHGRVYAEPDAAAWVRSSERYAPTVAGTHIDRLVVELCYEPILSSETSEIYVDSFAEAPQ